MMERIRYSLEQIWSVVPAFLAAALIFVAGYHVARLLERWLDGMLSRMNFNAVAEAGGFDAAVARTGARLDPVHAVGKLLFWMVMLIVTMIASAALGLESINEMFAVMISFLPALITATVVVVLGMLIGEFVRGVILATAGTVEGVPTLAGVAKGAVVLIAVFMALEQIGVAPELVSSAFTLILGALALAFGLSFGLGNSQLAGEIVRRWYEGHRRVAEPEPTGTGSD